MAFRSGLDLNGHILLKKLSSYPPTWLLLITNSSSIANLKCRRPVIFVEIHLMVFPHLFCTFHQRIWLNEQIIMHDREVGHIFLIILIVNDGVVSTVVVVVNILGLPLLVVGVIMWWPIRGRNFEGWLKPFSPFDIVRIISIILWYIFSVMIMKPRPRTRYRKKGMKVILFEISRSMKYMSNHW